MYLPNNCGISLTLNDPNFQSIYAQDLPYKGLNNLDQYYFAVVEGSNIVLKNTHDYNENILNIEQPAIGQHHKIKWRGHDVTVYRSSKQKFVVIGEPLSEVLVWWSNFSFFFAYGLLIGILLGGIIHLKRGFSVKDTWQEMPLQHRIQSVVIGLTVVLFFVIALATFAFIHSDNQDSRLKQNLFRAESLQKGLLKEELNQREVRKISSDFLASWSLRVNGDIDLYSTNGALLSSSNASIANTLAPRIIDKDIISQMSTQPNTIIPHCVIDRNTEYLKTYIGIANQGQLLGIIAISIPTASLISGKSIPLLMSSLLNVYVALLLVTWLASLFLISLLNKPLELVANRLSNFTVGKRNDLLEWRGDDAIGKLINEYNKMVHTVDITTQELVKSEREGAWKTMAQQIAHEVNNPLTPLRLNIQFLTRAFIGQQQPDVEAVKRITNSLVQQIDQLARIADQFKLFAQMGTPQASPLEISGYIEDFVQEYRVNNNSGLDYKVTETALNNLVINIDPVHLSTVLQHIIQYVTPVTSNDGALSLLLNKKDDQAILKLAFEGEGIPRDQRESIFNPSFSSNASQSGLGLPICRRIVEFYGGQLRLLNPNTFQIKFKAEVHESIAV
jgi:signal transduction histidine kinase